jgi:hypothetical protein
MNRVKEEQVAALIGVQALERLWEGLADIVNWRSGKWLQ